MLKTKTFLRKTKRGSVIKIVREHYLREDIWCGLAECSVCKTDATQNNLKWSPKNRSKLCDTHHFLIPDTNVVLHQVNIYLIYLLIYTVIHHLDSKNVRFTLLSVYVCLAGTVANVADSGPL